MRPITAILCATWLLTACNETTHTSVDPTPGPVVEALAPLALGARKHQAATIPAAVRAQLRAAANRLSDLQADRIGDNAGNGLNDTDPDDGGWDWTLAADASSHSTGASADNIYGATALGAWAAVRAGVDAARFRTTLLDVGLGSQENAEIDSPPDIVYLTLLAELSDNPGFTELARARYDARVAAGGGAQAIAIANRDQRHAPGHDGLIPYDLAWRTLAAAALDAAYPGAGYAADADSYAGVAVDDLTSATPLFDLTDPQENFYTHGLAWSLVVLARTGSAPDVLREARRLLLEAQHADGAWAWNGTYPNDDVQATAYAVQALALAAGNGARVRHAVRRGAEWLGSSQQANGGWQSAPDLETPEVDGEAMLALYLAQLVAGPDSLAPEGAAGAVTVTTSPLTVSVAAVGGNLPPLAAPAQN
jgi:hypothetical protein